MHAILPLQNVTVRLVVPGPLATGAVMHRVMPFKDVIQALNTGSSRVFPILPAEAVLPLNRRNLHNPHSSVRPASCAVVCTGPSNVARMARTNVRTSPENPVVR